MEHSILAAWDDMFTTDDITTDDITTDDIIDEAPALEDKPTATLTLPGAARINVDTTPVKGNVYQKTIVPSAYLEASNAWNKSWDAYTPPNDCHNITWQAFTSWIGGVISSTPEQIIAKIQGTTDRRPAKELGNLFNYFISFYYQQAEKKQEDIRRLFERYGIDCDRCNTCPMDDRSEEIEHSVDNFRIVYHEKSQRGSGGEILNVAILTECCGTAAVGKHKQKGRQDWGTLFIQRHLVGDHLEKCEAEFLVHENEWRDLMNLSRMVAFALLFELGLDCARCWKKDCPNMNAISITRHYFRHILQKRTKMLYYFWYCELCSENKISKTNDWSCSILRCINAKISEVNSGAASIQLALVRTVTPKMLLTSEMDISSVPVFYSSRNNQYPIPWDDFSPPVNSLNKVSWYDFKKWTRELPNLTVEQGLAMIQNATTAVQELKILERYRYFEDFHRLNEKILGEKVKNILLRHNICMDRCVTCKNCHTEISFGYQRIRSSYECLAVRFFCVSLDDSKETPHMVSMDGFLESRVGQGGKPDSINKELEPVLTQWKNLQRALTLVGFGITMALSIDSQKCWRNLCSSAVTDSYFVAHGGQIKYSWLCETCKKRRYYDFRTKISSATSV